jgi:fumarylacetoacetate (FAA) hydrolase
MKLSTYTLKKSNKELIGLLKKDSLINLNVFFGEISLLDLIQLPDWKELIINKTKLNNLTIHKLEEVKLLAPIPRPNSLRDAYAFRQHVETSRRNRGLEMIKEFDDFPVFYFSNHNAIFGPSDDIECMPSHFEKLDYELEIAILIGKEGRNIKTKNAKEYIAGFMIMNDMSSRGLQMKEMKLNLGPAKGKDFASVLGPYLVTPDELLGNVVNEDDSGCNYNLEMTCSVNGKLLSKGNLKDMAWSFEKIIERVSYGASIYAGDIIGSGTVGTGCLLEINGTTKLKHADFTEMWLKENDVVEMEIEKLGKITNKIISNNSNYKIN